jgi:hypothetical protein
VGFIRYMRSAGHCESKRKDARTSFVLLKGSGEMGDQADIVKGRVFQEMRKAITKVGGHFVHGR